MRLDIKPLMSDNQRVKTLGWIVVGTWFLGELTYAVYQDFVVAPRKRRLEEENQAYPEIIPTVEYEGTSAHLTFTVKTGSRRLRIDFLEAGYGVSEWGLDFLRPEEDFDRFESLGEPHTFVSLGEEPVLMPPYQQRTFHCELTVPPEMPETRRRSQAGAAWGKVSGLRIQLCGSRSKTIMVS